jgi:hypothetical protein
MDKTTTTIVVARYNEDTSWTKKLENVLVYNKGQPQPDYKEIELPNVGREGHTYYKHICDNYDNLSDITIFLQGNPFDHSPNIFASIERLKKTIEFEHLSENILVTNLSGCSYHHGLPMAEVFYKLFNTKMDNLEFCFGAGAQFAVSKKMILNRPKSFYMKIVEMLETSINPIEGFVIERLHSLIFSEMPVY